MNAVLQVHRESVHLLSVASNVLNNTMHPELSQWVHVMARSHCRTQIRNRIPHTAIGDRDPSLDLCNVNFQHITLLAKGKTLRVRVRIRVWQCEQAIKFKLNLYRPHLVNGDASISVQGPPSPSTPQGSKQEPPSVEPPSALHTVGPYIIGLGTGTLLPNWQSQFG